MTRAAWVGRLSGTAFGWGVATAAALAIGLAAPAAMAQEEAPAPAKQETVKAPEAAAPDADGQGERDITLKEGLKQLKRIRLKHFGQMRNTEIRQIGIAKLKDYTDPKFFPHLLEIFGRERADVQSAVLDLIADQKTDRGDATLAYAAVFEKDAEFRKLAAARLLRRTEECRKELAERRARGEKDELATPEAAKGNTKQLPPGLESGLHWRVRAVIVNGIQQKNDKISGRAANLAADLKLFDLIPALVNAQMQTPEGSAAGVGNGNGSGAIAFIMVGTQQAYVADLEPVVGDSAVGFDPSLGVVTSGTVLAINDAVVVTYRTEIHYALRRLANSGWDGRETDGFGYDTRQWARWYKEEFLPYRKAVASGHPEGEPLDD